MDEADKKQYISIVYYVYVYVSTGVCVCILIDK